MSDGAINSFDWFSLETAREKSQRVEEAVSEAMRQNSPRALFALSRDAHVVAPAELPPKPGLASREGQARLLHDLASIELQAMEMMVRTLYEYPDAPQEFRSELAEVAIAEGRHLALCLDGLAGLGYRWGHWDVHLSLWSTIAAEDSLLDRILIVHRYLEGSGLDAGESILRRLSGVGDRQVRQVVKIIVDEEVDHVQFGNRWYKTVAEEQRLDPELEFFRRLPHIMRLAPRRERLAREARRRAGFTEAELNFLDREMKRQIDANK